MLSARIAAADSERATEVGVVGLASRRLVSGAGLVVAYQLTKRIRLVQLLEARKRLCHRRKARLDDWLELRSGLVQALMGGRQNLPLSGLAGGQRPVRSGVLVAPELTV